LIVSQKSVNPIVRKNIKLKNIHLGERCFILGTGPSLKAINLEKLKNEITFGVNFLARMKDYSRINCKYYCLYDEDFYGKYLDYTESLINNNENTIYFVRDKALKIFKKKYKTAVIFLSFGKIYSIPG
jgi:hypothetical protein